jgi:SAM-dependent methyltransferase
MNCAASEKDALSKESSSTEVKPWFWTPVHPNTMKKILEMMAIDPAADNRHLRLLDFGCGMGRYLAGFATHIAPENLYGVDTDPEALAQVRQAGFQCFPLHPNEAVLDFKDNFFDGVFSSNVIEHIPRPLYLQYLAEIHRVLKPGGIFAVGAPNYPIKRVYDMFKAFKQPTKKERDYYLFDDPTHCNKASVFQVERDLAVYFEDIHLMPSALFFQKKIKALKKPDVQYRLRGWGDKFFGVCRKKAQ